MGWWFGRILTFEVIGDTERVNVGAVLADASNGLIVGDTAREIGGYAAYGQSLGSAVQPLVDCYAIELFDDGSVVRAPAIAVPQLIVDQDLGNSSENQMASRIQRERIPTRSLAGTLRLGYYDPQRDYQAGEARASANDQQFNEARRELPGAVSAGEAKSLAQQILARDWARREKLTLRLPPRCFSLEPGARLQLQLSPAIWSVERCTIDGFVVVAELRPTWKDSPLLLAEAGRIQANPDVEAEPLSLALFDIRNVLSPNSSEPTIFLAASNARGGWRSRPVQVSFAGQNLVARTAPRKSVLGRTRTLLPSGEPYLIDTINTVDVELIDIDQWLMSCDDEALAAGANIAAIGDEVIQFGEVTSLGGGQFRLSRLLRGRGGTEWAAQVHGSDEWFCLLETGTVQSLFLPAWTIGASATAAEPGGAPVSETISAETLRPPTPVKLAATIEATGDMLVNWTRRSRNGWAWTDEIDAPLAERLEQYRVTVAGSASSAEFVSDQPFVTVPAATVTTLGTGPAIIEVRQVGDLAASRPAQLSILLS